MPDSYLSSIFPVCSDGKDDSDNIQQEHEDDCQQNSKISGLIKAAELFKNFIHVNRVRCHQKPAAE